MDYREGKRCELTSPNSSDPPVALVSVIVSTLVQAGELPQDQANERGALMAQAFWHILSMAINPHNFDFPPRLGGRGIRKTNVSSPRVSAIIHKASSLEEALILYINLVCKLLESWRQQFAVIKTFVIEHFSAVPYPSEAVAFASNPHFVIDTSSGQAIPNQHLLNALFERKGEIVSRCLKRVAKKTPHKCWSPI